MERRNEAKVRLATGFEPATARITIWMLTLFGGLAGAKTSYFRLFSIRFQKVGAIPVFNSYSLRGCGIQERYSRCCNVGRPCKHQYWPGGETIAYASGTGAVAAFSFQNGNGIRYPESSR